jgi:hypothetical protein
MTALAIAKIEVGKGGCPLCGSAWASKEPWWKKPVLDENLAEWGTLYICKRAHPYFRDDEIPTQEAIDNREGCRNY